MRPLAINHYRHLKNNDYLFYYNPRYDEEDCELFTIGYHFKSEALPYLESLNYQLEFDENYERDYFRKLEDESKVYFNELSLSLISLIAQIKYGTLGNPINHIKRELYAYNEQKLRTKEFQDEIIEKYKQKVQKIIERGIDYNTLDTYSFLKQGDENELIMLHKEIGVYDALNRAYDEFIQNKEKKEKESRINYEIMIEYNRLRTNEFISQNINKTKKQIVEEYDWGSSTSMTKIELLRKIYQTIVLPQLKQ
jgi:hypothetical protein